MKENAYNFSADSIIDTAAFCNFHKNFVDYCKGKYECGTSHFLFRKGEKGMAIFETNGETIREDEYLTKLHTAP